MKCKVVSDGEKFKVLVKQFPLFWWTDPGFPAFDSYEKAKSVADENTDGNFTDCEPSGTHIACRCRNCKCVCFRKGEIVPPPLPRTGV